MTKKDIINKLQADQSALKYLLKDMFASDMKIQLESKHEYVLQLLEWIQQEGKV